MSWVSFRRTCSTLCASRSRTDSYRSLVKPRHFASQPAYSSSPRQIPVRADILVTVSKPVYALTRRNLATPPDYPDLFSTVSICVSMSRDSDPGPTSRHEESDLAMSGSEWLLPASASWAGEGSTVVSQDPNWTNWRSHPRPCPPSGVPSTKPACQQEDGIA